MLKPYRRHVPGCTDAAKGTCDCPIWCDGQLNGERYRRSLHTNDLARAQRRIDRLHRGDDAEPVAPPSARTLAAAVKVYLADCERRKVKPSSLRSYRTTFNALAKVMGNLPIADFDVHRLRAHQEKRAKAPRTERKEVEHLRAFCAFAIERGWMVENPAKKIKPPRAEDVPTMPFSADEVGRLLAACDAMRGMWEEENTGVRRRARALLLTLLYSGLRISDVAKLKRSALDGRHLTLRVMKTGVPLKVLLHPDAVKALNGLPAYRAPTYFFWSGQGKLSTVIGSLRRTIARIGVLANVHAHPHRCRDTFAVELLTNGVDIRKVQQLLGHESLKTTEKHYAHFVAAHQAGLDAAAATLDFDRPARLLVVDSGKSRSRNAK